MMNNLFSMFDPSTSYYNSMWYIMMAPMVIVMAPYNTSSNKLTNLMKILFTKIYKEMKHLFSNNNKTYSPSMVSKNFLIIMILNTIALMPFNFTTTAHLSISLVLSSSLWMSNMMYGWYNNFKMMMIHMTPMGTPNPLMNFMVIIEMVSNLIRPMTLSIRLSANMVAGHLLMSLMSTYSMASILNTTLSAIPLMMLTTLEVMVCLIQAYVFITLISLYHNESF